MRCLGVMKITEILRLIEMGGLTFRQIGENIGCSKTTVREINKRCRECGLTYDDAKEMTTEEMNVLIYPDLFGRKPVKEEPDWKEVHARLQSSKRINLQYLWE